MQITLKKVREEHIKIIRRIRWRTVLTIAACLPCAPALADVGQQGANEITEPAFPAPVEIVPAPLALSAPALRAVPLAWCEGATRGCTEIAPLDWKLADLHAARPPENQQIATNDFSASLLDGSRNRFVEGENEDLATVTPGGPGKPMRWADHVPREYATHRGFFKQAGTITTELLLFAGYFSIQSGKKFFKDTSSFNFNYEHWFGTNTSNVGVDKLTHAFDTYLIAEVLHARLHKTTHASQGDALTAAILASGFMALNEISDGIEPDHGYSMEDIVMNIAGAAFSVVRNTVPGVREKLAFKIEIVPNGSVYSGQGKAHFEQQRFMLSVKAAGFKGLKKTPLRFVDFQVGYYASDFLEDDRAAGVVPKRHLFVGLGLNVGELLFGRSRSKIGRAVYDVLDYWQLPYTSIRYDTTGRLGS